VAIFGIRPPTDHVQYLMTAVTAMSPAIVFGERFFAPGLAPVQKDKNQ
jgi:hypothetical protein